MSETRKCLTVLVITALFGGAEFYGSHTTHSFGILGDALHLVADGLPFVGTLGLILLPLLEEQESMLDDAILWFNKFFLFCSGVGMWEAGFYRLAYPEHIERSVVMYAILGFVGNVAQAYFAHGLRDVYRKKETHRSQMLHLLSDIASSGAVLISSALVTLTGMFILDSLISILVGGLTLLAIGHVGHDHTHGHAHQEHSHHH